MYIYYQTHDRHDLKPFDLNHLLPAIIDCAAQASAPPFLLSLFLLSNACAFIYLLLAVWLSMHVRASKLDVKGMGLEMWKLKGRLEGFCTSGFDCIAQLRCTFVESLEGRKSCRMSLPVPCNEQGSNALDVGQDSKSQLRLTRFVRLPIPSMKQIAGLRSKI